MKRILLTLPLCVGLTACSAPSGSDRTARSESFFAMDTYMTFTAYGANAEYALQQAKKRIAELEGLWSVTDAGSDIYAANHSGGQPVPVNGETEKLVSFALEMAEDTDGALEPTIYPILTAWGFTTGENHVPSQKEIGKLLEYVGYDRVHLEDGELILDAGIMLDLGAVGKGSAGDEAVQVFKENGVSSALLDIGGNIQAIGTKPDGSYWRVGLRSPFSDGVLGVIRVADAAVVTSGSYERYFIGEDGKRYGHIIDPVTGYPVDNGVASVTVIAGEGKRCDALSTALFVMGKEKAENYWRQRRDFDMIIVMEDGNLSITEGIEAVFSLQSEYSDMTVNVVEDQEGNEKNS
ncbi:MAG: FAD:protein FMN transferase [Lachnospiraceae bacterium]|nr:FAD:protein FMN transferase [Lachnospiraceae bacterium]MCM1215628.1 FAD:protein FMN transferase [Lachnospiraceae bacterium]MCM1238502.1 FAD:protein FMN transferase [Lachnospiraceae bacterium]